MATWTQTKRGRRLAVEAKPLGRWRATKHAACLRREANAVARHLGLEAADVTIAK